MGEDILAQRDEINVVVTTYDMAVKKQDTKFLKKLNANVCSLSSENSHFTAN